MRIFWLLGCAVVGASAARAAEPSPSYGPPATWVKAAPPETRKAPLPGAPAQFLLLDQQASLKPEGEDVYSDLRIKILAPEGLALGDLKVVWDPQTEGVTIHRVTITRDNRDIDVLATDRFAVVRREQNLEQAMLDGQLTASLQVKGLQVGDVLDFAMTRARRDPLLAGHPQYVTQLPAGSVEGRVRLRASWPPGVVRAKVSADLPKPGAGELDYEVDGLAPVTPPAYAPPRYGYLRTAELSGFASWSEVSTLMAPLFASAAALAPNSPLKAEAAKMRAASLDSAERMLRALALVQDQVRYVYVGLDSGAYRPARADETWARRFGDCKAKTALLLALLNELGIEAEPVLANSDGADELDQRLPRLDLFNHVLVRASVAGKTYWLDGTRLGDTNLAELEVYPYGWALPVRQAGADPLRLETPALTVPESETTVEIDDSAGWAVPARWRFRTRLRGDAGFILYRGLSALPRAQAEQQFRDSFQEGYEGLEPSRIDWSYDPARREFTQTVEATGTLAWKKDPHGAPALWYELENDGFGRLAPLLRPKDQDQSAPYIVTFPVYDRWVTTVRLPKGERISISDSDSDSTFGGHRLLRRTRRQGDTVVMYRSERTIQAEIPAYQVELDEMNRLSFNTWAAWVRLWDKSAPEPRTPEELVMRADTEAHAGETDKALAYADRALRAKPNWEPALRVRGDALYKAGRYAEAAEDLRKVIATSPHDEQLMLRRADALRLAGKYDAALQQITEDVAVWPHSPMPAMHRAQVWLAKGDFAQVLAEVDPLLVITPPFVEAYRLRALALWSLDRKPEALKAMERVVLIDPDDPANLAMLGSAYSEMGRYPDAQAALDEAMRIDPLDAATVAALAEVELRHGREAAALREPEGLQPSKPLTTSSTASP